MRYTRMTSFALHRRASLIEELNFLLTNRVSRRALRWFMGWLSKIEQPMVRDLSLAVWRLFTKLDLGDARKTRFASVHGRNTRSHRGDSRRKHSPAFP